MQNKHSGKISFGNRLLKLTNRRYLRFCLLVACLACSHFAAFAASAKARQSEVIAYIFPQEQVIQPDTIAAQKLTRINYAFANLQNGRIIEGFSTDAQNYAMLQTLKKQNPSLKILVSVGGWLWSKGFSDMALTPRSRAIFIASAVKFIEKYNLDGLDVDWEYPGLIGAGNRFRAKDKQNYTLLLKELHNRFLLEEKRLHRKLYLSIATGSGSEFLEHTEMSQVQNYVDSVNLMAYDYYEPSSDSTTGHHAPLFPNPADPKKISVDGSIYEYLQAGVKPEKIVLGVPFYGHVWGKVADHDHGLFQPGKAIPDAYAKYADISSKMLPNGYVRYWDSVASAPYLYNPKESIFISYEDPESLTAKCKYILEHKLGGIMFWDYSSDTSGALLNTIYEQLGTKSDTKANLQ